MNAKLRHHKMDSIFFYVLFFILVSLLWSIFSKENAYLLPGELETRKVDKTDI